MPSPAEPLSTATAYRRISGSIRAQILPLDRGRRDLGRHHGGDYGVWHRPVDAIVCKPNIANPHGSKGSPGWMLAKATVTCSGKGKLEYVGARTQMQKKVSGTWVTRTDVRERWPYLKFNTKDLPTPRACGAIGGYSVRASR